VSIAVSSSSPCGCSKDLLMAVDGASTFDKGFKAFWTLSSIPSTAISKSFEHPQGDEELTAIDTAIRSVFPETVPNAVREARHSLGSSLPITYNRFRQITPGEICADTADRRRQSSDRSVYGPLCPRILPLTPWILRHEITSSLWIHSSPSTGGR
jgi:hypothetical protein